MAGASSGRAERIRTLPREVGFKLQTLAVKALNRCSGSPKASRLKGCTWYWRLGCSKSGPDRVEDGGADVAGQPRQFVVGLKLHARPDFFRLVLNQRRHRGDAAGQAQRIGGDLAVGVGRQVVGGYRRRVLGPRRADAHAAARGRVEVADTGGEGVEAVQRLAEGVQAQRLHVVLEVRMLEIGRAHV